MSAIDPPVDGIALLLWAAEPGSPHRLATPFAMASAAAALDMPVEVYFTARSVLLLRPGVADGLRASTHPRTIGDWMRDARALGATFHACTDALHANGLTMADVATQCDGHGGAVRFMERAASGRWRTLVF